METNNIYLKAQPIDNIRNDNDSYPETIFGDSFSNFYSENYLKIHSGSTIKHCNVIREVPIQNLGITDMVSLATKTKVNFADKSINEKEFEETLRIRAFEFKINDWKKGLIQANRYKYFSHSTVLVVPLNTLVNALQALDTFKRLNVGLWGYDYESNVIKKVFTPRPNKKYSEKYFNIFKQKAFTFLTQSQPNPETLE